jgi:hypothetical protein
MSTPYTRAEYRAAEARREMRAIAETADILRQVASHDGHVDAYRGYVSVSLPLLSRRWVVSTARCRPRSLRASWPWCTPSTARPDSADRPQGPTRWPARRRGSASTAESSVAPSAGGGWAGRRIVRGQGRASPGIGGGEPADSH